MTGAPRRLCTSWIPLTVRLLAVTRSSCTQIPQFKRYSSVLGFLLLVPSTANRPPRRLYRRYKYKSTLVVDFRATRILCLCQRGFFCHLFYRIGQRSRSGSSCQRSGAPGVGMESVFHLITSVRLNIFCVSKTHILPLFRSPFKLVRFLLRVFYQNSFTETKIVNK